MTDVPAYFYWRFQYLLEGLQEDYGLAFSRWRQGKGGRRQYNTYRSVTRWQKEPFAKVSSLDIEKLSSSGLHTKQSALKPGAGVCEGFAQGSEWIQCHHYQYLSRSCSLEKSFRNNNPLVGFESFDRRDEGTGGVLFTNLPSKENILNAVHDDSILKYMPT